MSDREVPVVIPGTVCICGCLCYVCREGHKPGVQAHTADCGEHFDGWTICPECNGSDPYTWFCGACSGTGGWWEDDEDDV